MRNVTCSKYSACLAEAVKSGKKGFECDGCSMADTVAEVTGGEQIRAVILMVAALHPKIYRQYIEDRRAARRE
jgi:hypothetical protein